MILYPPTLTLTKKKKLLIMNRNAYLIRMFHSDVLLFFFYPTHKINKNGVIRKS